MKKRVVVFTRSYAPGFRGGGAVKAVQNIVKELAEFYDFRIVTLNRDYGVDVEYSDVPTSTWVEADGAHVKYLRAEAVKLSILRQIIDDDKPTVVYLNSLWDFVFTWRILLGWRLGYFPGVKIILGIRGQLNPGALAKHYCVKRCVLVFGRWLGLFHDVVLHATNQEEVAQVHQLILQCSSKKDTERCVLAEDFVMPQKRFAAVWQMREAGEAIRMVLVGRVCRMKNIIGAIEAVGKCCCAVNLDIVGPIEDEKYLGDCVARVNALPNNARVRFLGEMAPSDVIKALARYDLFFLPTLGENYCFAIAEALAAGVPMLISDRTPWHRLAEMGIAWEYSPDDAENFASRIDWFSGLAAERVFEIRERCLKNSAEILRNERQRNAHRQMFELRIVR